MTDEQLIKAARGSGIELYGLGKNREKWLEKLHKFAKLVAKHERLMCSKFLQETMNPLKPEYIDQIEEGIWND